MVDWNKLKSKLSCCACNISMTESEYINGIMLNKYAKWQNPSWGNILAIDEDKKKSQRATSIICDDCLVKKKKPKYAIEFRYKNGEIDKVIYHEINKLKDSDPITENDLVS